MTFAAMALLVAAASAGPTASGTAKASEHLLAEPVDGDTEHGVAGHAQSQVAGGRSGERTGQVEHGDALQAVGIRELPAAFDSAAVEHHEHMCCDRPARSESGRRPWSAGQIVGEQFLQLAVRSAAMV